MVEFLVFMVRMYIRLRADSAWILIAWPDGKFGRRGDEQDGVVGRWLREVDRIGRGRVCISVAQVHILIANVVGWRATNHTSL